MAGKACGIIQFIHKKHMQLIIGRKIVLSTQKIGAALKRTGLSFQTLVLESNDFLAVFLQCVAVEQMLVDFS